MVKKVNLNKKQEFQQFIEHAVFKLIEEMRLGELTVKIKYEYNKQRKSDDQHGMDALMMIHYLKPYKSFLLIICKNAFQLYQEDKKEELWNGVIHELCHIHTIPLMELATERYVSKREIVNTSEEITETLAQYVRELMNFRRERDMARNKNKTKKDKSK